jgi:hypothetical protein
MYVLSLAARSWEIFEIGKKRQKRGKSAGTLA